MIWYQCGFVLVVFLVLYFSGIFEKSGSKNLADNSLILSYFPAVKNDAAKITWDHAVNSQKKLKKSLQSDVMMLEADIMQKFWGTEDAEMVGIMAHPPNIDSDLTYKEFIAKTGSVEKGKKLDFKTVEILGICLKQLEALRRTQKLVGPILINADIITGPNLEPSDLARIDSTDFLKLTAKYTPWAALSVGWTTKTRPANIRPEELPKGRCYNWEDILKMHYALLDMQTFRSEEGLTGVPILTFPVRAALSTKRAVPKLRWLVDMWEKSSLTVWTAANDVPYQSAKDILQLRQQFSKKQLYLDLPNLTEDQRSEIASAIDDAEKRSVILGDEKPDRFSTADWTVTSTTKGSAFVGSTALVSCGFCTKLVSKVAKAVNPGSSLFISGRVEFFTIGGENVADRSSLKIVLRSTEVIDCNQINLSGIHINIQANGEFSISSKTDTNSSNILVGETKNVCYEYSVTDTGDTVRLNISSMESCDAASDGNNVLKSSTKIELAIPSSLNALRTYNIQVFIDTTSKSKLLAIEKLDVQSRQQSTYSF